MLKLFSILLLTLLIVGNLLAISTVNENGDADYDSSLAEPNFQMMGQDELAKARSSNNARGIAGVITTPCGEPPTIANGAFTLIIVFMSGDLTTKSYLLSYSCKASHRLVGKTTLICSSNENDNDNDNNWGQIPTCVKDNYDDKDATSVNTECSTNPSPADVLACFPNVVVRYKFSSETSSCERYLACEASYVGFATLEDCRAKCQRNSATTQKPTITLRSSLNSDMNGGRRGPQCLSNVPITHSSCLSDSPYLQNTLPNNVTEILAQHNFWRARVDPPASPPMPSLRWDDELAISAERWAAQCQFTHNTAEARKIPSRSWTWVGQNLCGASFDKSWTDCITSWGLEYKNWTYGAGPLTSTATVGHYTQIINANTTHIGCGRARCSNVDWNYILVCNYGPGGNIGYQSRNPYAFPYTVAGAGQPVITPSTSPWPIVTAPQTRPVPSGFESGGKRGPQCVSGVDSAHSSCLSDSANLVSTVRFNYDEILSAHNKVRREVWPPATNMPTLQWSEDLATAAERWAAQCRIAHNTAPDRRMPQWKWVGQNMRFSTNDRSWQETVANWASESANYRYGIGPWPTNSTVGHYTQIIWAETTHVGCGKAICRNIFWNYIYVCNYGPGGNVGINTQSPFLYPYIAVSSDSYSQTVTRLMTTRTRAPIITTPTTTIRPNTRGSFTSATTPNPSPSSNGRMSGGLRGSQCLPNVDRSHSSCLADSLNLVRTYRFGVDEILRMHNQYRRNVQPPARKMPMLQYSEDLAVMAERWAAQCPNGHNSGDTRATAIWDWVGQNICWKSGADETWTECIDAWGSEQKNWRYGVGPVPSNAMVGHYTQLVWGDTIFVGCGKAYCKNSDWEYTLVCNYGPGGNIGNGFQSPYAYPYEST